jgi:hypothetical protein
MNFSRDKLIQYIDSLYDQETGTYASVYGQGSTLYGTGYAVLTKYYLGIENPCEQRTLEFISNCQEEKTGYFVGPELQNWSPPSENTSHTREHLLMHLTISTLPVLNQFGQMPKYPLKFAHAFTDSACLSNWLNQRDLTKAWLEGNNLLFIGQLLVFLRDVEKYPNADQALVQWFKWLDERIDPATGLWGTNPGCDHFGGVYGGYHQLLVYYYENHPIRFPDRLVDVVLELQHPDGGFAEYRGGGACEDVDCVDILVNLYKLYDYRRADIRFALRKCLNHLWTLQRSDGGFPSSRLEKTHIHMGIPATKTSMEHCGMFETWFRVHTFTLIAEILTDEPRLHTGFVGFNSALSMGWHPAYNRNEHPISTNDRRAERIAELNFLKRSIFLYRKRLWNKFRGMLHKT